MTSAANHPMTATTNAAIPRKNKTMNCGMARMMRKITVTRLCGAVPAYHMSTRLVGTAIEALVMSAPFVRYPSPETGTSRTLEHGHLLTVDFPAFPVRHALAQAR